MTDDLLKRGIAAIKEGHKAEARKLLAQVVEQDERNEMAWLWMSGVVDTDAERRVCLENVLAINPDNEVAKRGLERLGIAQKVSPFAPARSPAPDAATEDGQRPIQSLAQASEPGKPDAPRESREEKDEATSPPQQETEQRAGPSFALWAGLLTVACIAAVGIWWAVTNGWLSPEPTPTLMPTAMPTVNVRQTPTRTSLPTWTPRATDVPPTLLPTWTPRPSKTPLLTWTPSLTPTATPTGTIPTPRATPAITLPPTWTPHPTSTPMPGITRPPTWTPQPTNTSVPTTTLPPTWTPASIITLPPTWTPAYPTSTPVVTQTPTLTGTLVITATPGG
jgi:hypothetical protein